MTGKRVVIAVMAAELALLAYLGAAGLAGGLGFPLDDAWIHQTYARNLATTGRWAYDAGRVSAGSTSPLWTVLLSLGYVLKLDFRLWTYLLGFLALAATLGAVYRLGLHLFPQRPIVAPLAALLAAGEWHLVWAAGSGMETLLFTALSLLLLDAFVTSPPDTDWDTDTRMPLLPGPSLAKGEGSSTSSLPPRGGGLGWGAVRIGLLGGLLTLTRPEGMVLLALVGGAGLLQRRNFRWLLALGLGFALLIVPYLLFNRASGAGWLPNTFYAKQQEYAVLLVAPYPLRLARLIATTWVGPQVLLVPGFVWLAMRLGAPGARGSLGSQEFLRVPVWLPLVWWLAFLALYAWRLPVTYQHGRYLIPSIPILLLYGVAGTAALIRPASPRLWPRLIGRTAVAAVVILALVFLARGAWAYVVDVQIVNSEMVAAAEWLREHTPPEALVAAHDIGAIGYYADRPLIDLAGLVTPEVIPFMRDEARLKAFIQAQKAAYLVTFPGWYPQLTADPCFRPVYQSTAGWSPGAGGEHMVVYRTCW
jgi:hypothetical protein